jgi:hypothetical protein
MGWIGTHKRWAAAIIAIVALLGAATAVLLLKSVSDIPIPLTIRQRAPVTLYYPASLPKSYVIDQDSFDLKQSVVTYTISSGDKKVFVSQQAKPSGFDFTKLNDDQMQSSTKIATPNGEAVLGTLGENNAASLVTVDSWVLMTAPPNLPLSEIQSIVASLKPAPRD